MRRTTILKLLLCFATSIALMWILYGLSDHITHKHNTFTRLLPPNPVRQENLVDAKFNSYYIAGATKNHFYFGNTTAPLHLLVTNTLLADTQHITIKIENLNKLRLNTSKIKIDSPYFYIMDGIMPTLLRGNIQTWHADRFMYDSAYFTESVPITHSSFALRVLSKQSSEYVLAKEAANEPHIKFAPGILEKQIDGRFCVDGMLHYSKTLQRLVYVYYYRNQYIVMDSSLELMYKGNTIDTTSKAKIEVASISSENARTMAAPPLVVNKHSCISGNWLFIHANLRAQNEDKELFDKTSVIDVYDVSTKEYKFSFYLFDYNKKKLKTFQVYGNILIALFDHYIVTYNLAPQYFPKSLDSAIPLVAKLGEL